MNKKTKALALLILAVFSGICIMEKLDKRPFRFEDFKTADELKLYLKGCYPIGSNGDIAYKNIELAGAKCQLVLDRETLPNPKDFKKYDYIVWCEYSSGWISWPPKERYIIRVLGDKDKKIIKFSVAKYSGLII